MDYVLFDRENGFVVEKKGREAKDSQLQDTLWETQQSFEE